MARGKGRGPQAGVAGRKGRCAQAGVAGRKGRGPQAGVAGRTAAVARRSPDKAAGKPEEVLPSFRYFGFDPEDDGSRDDLNRLIPAIEAAYYELMFTVEMNDLRDQLEDLCYKLHSAASAMRNLSRPAADYLIGYKPELALYNSHSAEADGPEKRSERFDMMFDRVFGKGFEEIKRADAERMRKYNDSDFKRYELACVSMAAAEDELRRVLEEKGAVNRKSDISADRKRAVLSVLIEREKIAWGQFDAANPDFSNPNRYRRGFDQLTQGAIV